MPGHFSRRIASLILALALFAGAAWGQGFTPIGNGVSLRFEQINWLGDDGTTATASSRVGLAELAFDDTAAGLLVGPDGAFLNLYTSLDGASYTLSVENLYLQFDDLDALLYSNPSVFFDLGNTEGVSIGNLTFQATVTYEPVDHGDATAEPDPEDPLPPPPGTATDDETFRDFDSDVRVVTKRPLPLEPVYTAPVPLGDYLVGGFDGGGSGQLGGMPPQPAPWRPGWRPGPGVVRPRPLGAVRVPPGGLPAVNEDRMGCAPGGVARSIRYMLDRRGLGGPNVQNIYNGLYNTMQTNRPRALSGTSGQNMVNGKAQWAAANGYNINTQFPAGLNQAINALNNRGDVEINILWPGGGHVAMVTSISQLPNGLIQITYIDDPRQGDGRAQNQTTTLVVNPVTGAIVAGFPLRGAVVGTFLVENMP
jgi:hypothetical protein